jgi:CHAD domain-containing protein
VDVHRVAGHGKQRRRIEQLCDDLDLERADGDGMAAALEAATELLSDERASSDRPLNSMLAADGFRAVLAPMAIGVSAYWRSALVSDDAELVRGLRVASRRSRSVLLNAQGVLPDDVVSRAKQGLALIGEASGPIRDLDAYLDGWAGYIEQCSPEAQGALEPVRRLIEQRRVAARSQLVDRKAGVAIEGFLRDWQRWLAKPASSRAMSHCPAADSPLSLVVVSCIERAHTTLIDNGRKIVPGSPATQLHDLRKDAKRLRYLLECFGALFPSKERKVFVRRLKSLQDNLGGHQDAEVHGAQLQTFMDLPESISFTDETRAAAAELAELFHHQCQVARCEFSSRFAEFDSAPTAAALAQLLAAT